MEVIDNSFTLTSFPHSHDTSTLCCLCGTAFNAGFARTNICLKCLSPQTDITAGITKQIVLNHCSQCDRYLGPPWISCEIGSKELLSFCLNRIKGLNQVQLLDASFLWTNPQSKRIKVKLSVQKKIYDTIRVIQTFPVEFSVQHQQCEDCQKSFAADQWEALVQIKQHGSQKKTFYLLEQLILKHDAHADVLKIKDNEEGLHFYFKSKSHAQRLIDFIQTVFPLKVKLTKQLIHQNESTGAFCYKYTFLAELPKVCRDDLVVLSQKLRTILKGCSPVLICQEIAPTIRLFDPFTMQTIYLSGAQYFQHEDEFTSFSLREHGTEFTVSSIETQDFKSTLPKISVMRNADKKNFVLSTQPFTREQIKVGNGVFGYELAAISANGSLENNKNLHNLQEVILVKRSYPELKKTQRFWTLKHLPKENMRDNFGKIQELNNSFEEFLSEIEENPEIRACMNLFRDEKVIRNLESEKLDTKAQEKKKVKVKNIKSPHQIKAEEESRKENPSEEAESTDPMVKIEELLSDLTLNDPETTHSDLLDNDTINEFVSQLGKIKIEK